MKNQNVITKKGLDEIRAELKKLIEIERPKVIEDIKEARGQGDLSENAEFDAAREKQGQIEDRISEIERIINGSRIIDSTSRTKNDKVRIGSTVEVLIGSKRKSEIYTIVGSLEADPFEKKISNVSPLGAALLNNSKDKEVTFLVETPTGDKRVKAIINDIRNN